MCLKHFRERGYGDICDALSERTDIKLEHEIVSELYEILVNEGDYQKVEEFMEERIAEGILDQCEVRNDHTIMWQPVQESVNASRPGNHSTKVNFISE